jgi:hypothetical protein
VFKYIWPEHTIDRLRAALRAALQQLARLVEIPGPQTSIAAAKSEAHALIGATSESFDHTRRYVELTQFEFEESTDRERSSLGNLEATLSRAEHVFIPATSLASDQAWNEWVQLPIPAQIAESELRDAVAKRIERVATGDTYLSNAFARWTETMQALQVKNSRVGLVSQLVTEVQQLKSIPNQD